LSAGYALFMQTVILGMLMFTCVSSALGNSKLKNVSDDLVTGNADSIGFHLVTVDADGCSVWVVDNLSSVLLNVTSQWVVCIKR
jgi:hypothetical protein